MNKVMHLIIVALAIVFASSVKANDFMLTEYKSLNKHGNHSYEITLPNEANHTHRQYLEVELGCAEQGCSDWDYTIRFEWIKDGVKYELGRLITPYAGYMQRNMQGFDRDWRRTYVFEVSHLAPVLVGEGEFNVHYGGWGAKKSAFGFSAKLLFKGSVQRKVERVIPIYYSPSAGWAYKTADKFAQFLPSQKIDFQAGEEHSELKVIVSAHGHALSFDNPDNEPQLCGEWCERYFDLKVNNTLLKRTPLWRDDCDQSATFPQGGTYIYSRANWCPGERVEPFSYSINTSNAATDIDIDWQAFSWQPSQYSKQAPRYIISAVLITYAEVQNNTDLALEELLSPNNALASRDNQSCSDVTVSVFNQGNTQINNIYFKYGVSGQKQHTFHWQGQLNSNERRIISLPSKYWGEFDSSEAVMQVRAQVINDEITRNNAISSKFDLPLSLSKNAKLQLLTGKFAEETRVIVKDRYSKVVKEWQDFSAVSDHELALELPTGCYSMEIHDSAHDGLAFPFLNQSKGKGAIAVSDTSLVDGEPVNHDLQPDFGRLLKVVFTSGYTLGGCAAPKWQTGLAYAQVGEKVNYQGIIYQAKHWSYNFQPDQAGPYDAWQAVSYCDGSAL